MPDAGLSTIAQLLCHDTPAANFARLVGDLEEAVSRLKPMPCKLSWDCDDVATFDLPGMRILLAWSEHPGGNLAGVLTVSVGPSPEMPARGKVPDPQALCRKLVARVRERITTTEVLWRQIDCAMDAGWVDLLVEALPGLEHTNTFRHAPAQDADPPPLTSKRKQQADARTSSEVVSLLREDSDLVKLRMVFAHEQPRGDTTYSVPMRLAVHSMNATLIMVWTPLGVAAMAYSVMRGEDMRRSAQLMVLTGMASAVLNSPTGQQFLAMLPSL